jgi:hypothetical protein
MPLQKLQFKPGVDRENTRYAAEGSWYETNKVRFRRGMPQKIGGWVRLSNASFLASAALCSTGLLSKGKILFL